MSWQCKQCKREWDVPESDNVICACGWRSVSPLPRIRRVVRPPLEEAGRASWLLLHSYPGLHREDWDPETAKQWLVDTWEPTIPSYGCSCEAKYQEFKKTLISDTVFDSPEAFYQFGVDLHNLVNQELGKPIFVPPIA